MNRSLSLASALAMLALGGLRLGAATADDSGALADNNPYAVIADRNVFHLNPPSPPPDQSKAVTPPDLPDVKLTGFLAIGDSRKVLFALIPKDNKQPPTYLTLSPGEREGALELVRIHPGEEEVDVINGDTAQTLSIRSNSYVASAAPPPGPGSTPMRRLPGLPQPPFRQPPPTPTPAPSQAGSASPAGGGAIIIGGNNGSQSADNNNSGSGNASGGNSSGGDASSSAGDSSNYGGGVPTGGGNGVMVTSAVGSEPAMSGGEMASATSASLGQPNSFTDPNGTHVVDQNAGSAASLAEQLAALDQAQLAKPGTPDNSPSSGDPQSLYIPNSKPNSTPHQPAYPWGGPPAPPYTPPKGR